MKSRCCSESCQREGGREGGRKSLECVCVRFDWFCVFFFLFLACHKGQWGGTTGVRRVVEEPIHFSMAPMEERKTRGDGGRGEREGGRKVKGTVVSVFCPG